MPVVKVVYLLFISWEVVQSWDGMTVYDHAMPRDILSR